MNIKDLMVCADDFGQHVSISEGILALAAQQRINAVSCMVNGGDWLASARMLHAVIASDSEASQQGSVVQAIARNDGVNNSFSQTQPALSVGLHFNLTEGRPLSPSWRKQHGDQFPSLPQLIGLLYRKKLDLSLVHQELLAQWDAFTVQLGQAPDFVDGHQHIHQLLGVRQVCCDVFRLKAFQGWCRVTSNGIGDWVLSTGFPKPMAMWLLGGHAFKKRLRQQQINTNTSFFGFYPFKQAASYRHYFRGFLAKSQKGGVIMCHPGLPSQDQHDPLYGSRPQEFSYFASDAYVQDLKEFGFG